MVFGLDYVTGPPIADMKAAHVEFVCRYTGYFAGYNINAISTPQGKCLSTGEAKALMASGIEPVSNFEWYANRAVDGATPAERHGNGAWDAGTADTIHRGCGGPPDRPIYFSVDADVSGDATAAYFQGVASRIGLARTGAYGSYRVLAYLFDAHLITWGWQTYAWSGGHWEPRAHIQQYLNGVSMSGHSVDYNRSIKPDFGAWRTETMTITIATPGVSNYFTASDAHHWQCKQTGKVIQYGILDFYQAFGGNALCGLTHLGLPVSNEIALGGTHGAMRQHFERGVLFYDPAQEFDKPPGAASVYTAHLYKGQGQDPKIAELETQLKECQAQVVPVPPPMTGLDPAKVTAFQQAMAAEAHQITVASQKLETDLVQPIS